MEFHAAVEYTRSDMKIYQHFHRKYKRRLIFVLSKLLGIVCIAILLFCLVLNIYYGHELIELLFTVVLIGILIATTFFRDGIEASAMLRKRVKGTEHMECVFDDEALKVSCAAIKDQYGYAAIQEIYRVKGIFLLYVDKNHAVILPERCFTQGSPDDFADFISRMTGKSVIAKKK